MFELCSRAGSAGSVAKRKLPFRALRMLRSFFYHSQKSELAVTRLKVREMFDLHGNVCRDILVGFCCYCCALGEYPALRAECVFFFFSATSCPNDGRALNRSHLANLRLVLSPSEIDGSSSGRSCPSPPELPPCQVSHLFLCCFIRVFNKSSHNYQVVKLSKTRLGAVVGGLFFLDGGYS